MDNSDFNNQDKTPPIIRKKLARFSFFPRVTHESTGPVTLAEMFDRIRSDEFEELAREIRSEPEKRKRNALKTHLPCASISGIVDGLRKDAHSEGRFTPNGYLACDFDIEDFNGKSAEEIQLLLKSDDHSVGVFLSPSGGVKAIILIPIATSPEELNWIFRCAETYFWKSHGLKMDTRTKDSVRLTYYSHDPKAWLRNGPAKVLTISPQLPKGNELAVKTVPKQADAASEPASEVEPTRPNAEIIASVKAKSHTAAALWKGNWEGNVGPSQSEADFSLACSICEETSSHRQQDEIFRLSGLFRNDHKTGRAIRAAREEVAANAAIRYSVDFPRTAYDETESLAEFPLHCLSGVAGEMALEIARITASSNVPLAVASVLGLSAPASERA